MIVTYKAEERIRDLVLNNNTIAYCSPVETCIELPQRATASIANINFDTPHTDDLFYTRSILVSTSVNLNDDHFSIEETWRARKTPIDKPSNIGHDQSQIIGHITSQWAVDDDGNIIADDSNVDELPEFYHIANGSVIYKKFPGDEELQEKADQLIAEISNDDKFVSMECLFKNFAFAVHDGDNRYVVARNQETAFLTEHLRAYGGSGEFDGMKIYRSLMDINFCGKGFVDQPANSDSIIFAKDKLSKFSFAYKKDINPFLRTNGVYFNCKANIGDNSMADEKDAKISELEKVVASLEKEIKDADAKALLARIDELEGQIEAHKTEAKEISEKLEKEQEAKACMCDQVEKVASENEKLKDELAKLQAQARKAQRIKAFVNKGFDDKDAEVEAEATLKLDDEMFKFLVDRIPSKADRVEANDESSLDDTESEVEIEAESAEENKTSASVGDSVDEELVARAALIKGIQDHFKAHNEVTK